MSDEEKRRKAAEYQREYRLANKERLSEYKRERHKRRKHLESARSRMRLYGITQDQFDSLLAAQDHSCAVCRTQDPGKRGTFFVDHCHASGAVRGLLCLQCNVVLGMSQDNPDTLRRAISYLAAPPAREILNKDL